MKHFRWNHQKNAALKNERDISFEQIVLAIEGDGLLDCIAHPTIEKYPNQSPYQTLIASVLHKYVSGRLIETPSGLTTRSAGRAKKLRAGSAIP
jgi:hypothetical protein